MSMTREEKFAKKLIIKLLMQQGYRPYADILQDLDFNFTNHPKKIAALYPSEGRIVVNRGLDEHQISTVIRHEILHEYLEHESRLIKKLANEMGIKYKDISDIEISDLDNIKQVLYGDADKKFNRAADYEISNYAYTDADKDIVRQINLNGKILQGLVTEDEHPDWVDMSVEEMFDELRKLPKEKVEEPPKYYGVLIDERTFTDFDGVIYGV